MHEKRLLMAIVLSMAVVFTWQAFFPPPMPRPKPRLAALSDTSIISSESGPLAPAAPAMISETVSIPLDTSIIIPVGAPRELVIERPRYRVRISEKGGAVRELNLPSYPVVHPNGKTSSVNLVSGDTEIIGHLAVVMDPEDRSRMADGFWAADTTSSSLRLVSTPRVAELPSGIRLEKTLIFEDTYAADLTFTVHNGTGRPQAFSTASMNYPIQNVSREGSFLIHFGPGLGVNDPDPAYLDQYIVSGSFGKAGKNNDAVSEHSWTHSIFGLPEASTDVEWAAIANRYFAIAAMPSDFKVDALFQSAGSQLHLWLLLPSFELASGDSKQFNFRVFSGPKSTEVLRGFSPELQKLDGMEPTVLPKRISIARMMVSLLAWIEGFVHNWGWSIIILTIIVRGLLFPLAHYQFKSMARMQSLKPRIDELQLRYANDKERLQRELMNVYRDAGVNPLGGCLPILVQMPILVGLFLALQNSIELRGAGFLWWMSDLSIPDTIFHVMGLPINPLPLVMGGTMWIQQKLTPMPSADPAQQQVMMMMPIMMTVLFYNFPSGLSIYWITQNILSIGQQYYIMRVREVTPSERTGK